MNKCYDDMEIKGTSLIVGFWTEDFDQFDRDEYLSEFDGYTDAVVVFDPETGVITIHQFIPFLLPREIAGVNFSSISFSGISQKRVSPGGYDRSQAKEVFQKVFQLRNEKQIFA